MSELPPGWASATVADLIAPDGIFSDGDWVESKDQDPSGAIRLLQLADIGDGAFVDKSNRFVNDEKFEKLRCTEVFEDDVLIARMPDPLGRACLAPKLRQRCITVVDVAIVRPGESSVKPKWMMHFLNAPPVRERIELQSSGTTRRRISRGNLAQLELPIPPLLEQKRIAARLDALLARVDACREHLDRVPAILKRFRKSVLAAATGGELTRDWRDAHRLASPNETTLGEVIRVSSGKFLPAKEMAPGGTIPVFGGNGVNGYHDKANVEEETLVIGRVGFYCGSVHLTPQRAWVTDNALIVRHDPQRTSRRFLYFALQALDLRANDSSTAQPVISGAKIYPTSIVIPEMPEQAEIVRRIDALFDLAAHVEKQHATVASNISQVVPSLLAKAFRGELVPQDRADEPASELLARIRNRPAAPNTSGKPKRGGRAPRAKAKAETEMLTRKDVPPTHLTSILKERGALTAEALWTASQLEIDDFYAQLKDEEARGLLRENRGDSATAPRLLEAAA